ncbi:MAG: MotA/TolQ/ExbB proton channel family protein [Planctomycetota bacterium]|nr:MotA/TolQ/ExbB proton channel family protein [Planctomycetota bacterium]
MMMQLHSIAKYERCNGFQVASAIFAWAVLTSQMSLGQPPQMLPGTRQAQPSNSSQNNVPGGNNGGARQYNALSPQSPPSGFSQPSGQPSSFGQPNARLAANNSSNPLPSVNAGAVSLTEVSAKEATIPTRNLLQMFHDGGLMMYPIALCSFVLTVFSFERFISLRSGRVIPRPFVKRLIEQLQQGQIDREEALELCERNPSPIAAILSAAVKKYGRPAVEVEQAVLDAGERESNLLRRNMRLLNAISNVSPLLGLLGTVLGMIQAFNDIASAQAMGRPDLLAGGISQALLTTAAGLLVAIPAYLIYMFFLGRTDKLVMEMDSYAQQLVEVVSAEGLHENDSTRTRTRARKAA